MTTKTSLCQTRFQLGVAVFSKLPLLHPLSVVGYKQSFFFPFPQFRSCICGRPVLNSYEDAEALNINPSGDAIRLPTLTSTAQAPGFRSPAASLPLSSAVLQSPRGSSSISLPQVTLPSTSVAGFTAVNAQQQIPQVRYRAIIYLLLTIPLIQLANLVRKNESRNNHLESGGHAVEESQPSELEVLRDHYQQGKYKAIEAVPCNYKPSTNPRLEAASKDLKWIRDIDQLQHSVAEPIHLTNLAKLLAHLSQHRLGASNDYTLQGLVLQSNIPAGTPAVPNATMDRRLESMVACSARASAYLTSRAEDAGVATLKLMLSYIMLHITLEVAIVRRLRLQHPDYSQTQIDGEKYQVLCDEINHINGTNIGDQTMKDRVRYGKVLWTIADHAGVAILPLLAIAGPGITVISRHFNLK